jgi:hypothetical protein
MNNDYRDLPELLKAVQNTKFASNTWAGIFHPELTAESYALANNEIHAVRIFSEAIENLTDFDYGDFMRKANAYICDLRVRLQDSSSTVHDKIDQMQSYIQFDSSWEVEPTRRRLLLDARILV